jgi:hypothetical protein
MRYNEIKLVEDIVNEINMSPKSLQKLTSVIDAKVGIEFEFIYRKDYDYLEYVDKNDVGASSIRGVLQFFTDSDIELDNDDAIEELSEKLDEEYDQWSSDIIEKTLNDPDEQYVITETLRKYFYETKRDPILSQLENRITQTTGYEQGSEEFRKIFRWHNSMSDGRRSMMNNDDVLTNVNNTSNSDEIGLKDYYEIRKPIYDKIDEKITDFLEGKKIPEVVSLTSHLNSEVKRRFANQLIFFRENYPLMSDVYNKFSDDIPELSWPQIKSEIEIDDILSEFQSEVGSNYEIETDSSIRADDDFDDTAVEIKTDGALPLEQALTELRKAKTFIENNGYTNDTTGLHINISIPSFNRSDLDYVKLVLLLGDEYILKEFNRKSNTYAQSSMKEISKKASSDDITTALVQLQDSLENIAGRIIHDGWTDKYTSVNIHSNRVEFRGMGGDWIEDQSIDNIIDNIRRMVVALDAALDPTKYQREYAKKLYKFFKPYSEYDDLIKVFAMYGSNKIPKAALKSWINKFKRNRPVINSQNLYWAFGDKDLRYTWGSGKTKSEAMDNSRNEIMSFISDKPNKIRAWNEEIQNCTFLPIDKAAHDKIQDFGTIELRKDRTTGIYVER